MVQLALAFVTATLVSVQATPFLDKRIQQVIDQSMVKWQAACVDAINDFDHCNQLAIEAFSTLLANNNDCAQQDAADDLMKLSKEQKSEEMIKLTQVFIQQPRNSPNSVSIPYCQKAPKNRELKGLFHCQYIGDKQFDNGAKGSIPFGMTAPLNPPGSCPAHPQGPIADGSQLTDITTEPFASGGGSSAGADSGSDGTPSTTPSVDGTPSTPTATPSDDGNSPPSSSSAADATVTPSTPATAPSDDGNSPPSPSSAADGTVPTAAPGGFQLQNGLDAQKLNSKFSTLNADSPCDAENIPNACIDGQFAKCVDGKFSITGCNSGTQCFALPLVNSRGTSVTCDTEDDAKFRFSNTGAPGGITGSD